MAFGSSVPHWILHRLARVRRILSCDAAALSDVVSALLRAPTACIDCGQPIDPMRLEFNPHGSHFLYCEERAERALG
jgi:RNA polymerase-binding transcription factor DksA